MTIKFYFMYVHNKFSPPGKSELESSYKYSYTKLKENIFFIKTKENEISDLAKPDTVCIRAAGIINTVFRIRKENIS